ncbi:MAG: NAD-dependent epimerase [Salinivirgaceae bacterium]
MKVLVTGAAGFIGFHLVKKLIDMGEDIVGLDNINDYYDLNLKYGRLNECGILRENISDNQLISSVNYPNYHFIKTNLEDSEIINDLFEEESFDVVVNLAAQPGVRYSLQNPQAYIQSNIVGFLNILEACRHNKIKHLVYASSSSVYGLNKKIPFSTSDNVDHPVSLYAATKKSNELMAHAYSHLYNLPTTGLRFFTVYGPWGRPDMALFLFTKAILNGEPIKVFNKGDLQRDFTYIDDIVSSIEKVIENPPEGNPDWSSLKPDPSSSEAPYRIYNIGNNNPVKLLDFIEAIEKTTGRKAIKEFLPMQPGDVYKTWADCSELNALTGYEPNTSIKKGIEEFVNWFLIFNR